MIDDSLHPYVYDVRLATNDAIVALCEHLLELVAAAGMEADDRPRFALAMLRRGETLDAAKTVSSVSRMAEKTDRREDRTAWLYVVRTIKRAATCIHGRRSDRRCGTMGYDSAAASVVWSLGMFGNGEGSGSAASEYVRVFLAKHERADR